MKLQYIAVIFIIIIVPISLVLAEYLNVQIGTITNQTFYAKYFITPQYESTTKIYLIAKNDDSSKITTSDLQLGSQLTNDYMTLVKSRPVLEGVINDLNLDVNLKSFSDLIQVNNPDNTRIIGITARYNTPESAKLIADSVRQTSAVHIKEIMDLEEVNVVEEGNTPQDKISPNVLQNTIIGGILGGIVVTLIILIIYFLDDTIKTPEDVERYLGLSVLGSIPLQEGETRSKKEKKRHRITKKKKRKAQPEQVN